MQGKAETDWEELLSTPKTGFSMSVYAIFYRYEGPDVCKKPDLLAVITP